MSICLEVSDHVCLCSLAEKQGSQSQTGSAQARLSIVSIIHLRILCRCGSRSTFPLRIVCVCVYHKDGYIVRHVSFCLWFTSVDPLHSIDRLVGRHETGALSRWCRFSIAGHQRKVERAEPEPSQTINSVPLRSLFFSMHSAALAASATKQQRLPSLKARQERIVGDGFPSKQTGLLSFFYAARSAEQWNAGNWCVDSKWAKKCKTARNHLMQKKNKTPPKPPESP